jgi:hypothetical protein
MSLSPLTWLSAISARLGFLFWRTCEANVLWWKLEKWVKLFFAWNIASSNPWRRLPYELMLSHIQHQDCLSMANYGIPSKYKTRYREGIKVRKHQTCFQTSRMLFDMSFRPMTCDSNPDCSMTDINEKWILYPLNNSISQQVGISISSLTMFSASLFLFRNWSVFRHDRMSHSAGTLCSLSLISMRLTSHVIK